MDTRPELIFATGNQAKLAQMAFVIRSLKAPLLLVSASERYGSEAAYKEQGSTAGAVALNGARFLAGRLGVPMVTEDTALYVLALEGRPGVQAGRYLKEHGRAGLLREMAAQLDRRASIVSAVAWASPDGDSQTWMTSVEGEIAQQEHWLPGLPDWIAPSPDSPLGGGYNSVFIPIGLDQTLAQIPPEDALQLGYREPNFCAVVQFILERAGPPQSQPVP